MATVLASAAPLQAGPYKFLDYYGDSAEDRRRFGGREREVREIVARITNGRTFVLYGRSGIGKTSLLLAGIFPVLRERGYQPVYARTLTSPIDDLRQALAEACGLPSPADRNLRQLVMQAEAEGPVVVALDQFEEFFIRFRDRPQERETFIEAIAEAISDEKLNLTVVFSLREDFLAELDDFRGQIPDLFSNEFRLRALTAFGVRQAISLPLLEEGISYEEVIISKLVDQMESFGFDPPVLQIICTELYKEAKRRAGKKTPRLTTEDLAQVGGLEGIFRRYLDGLNEVVPKKHHLLTRMVLDALITRDSTKQAATLEDLLAMRFSATPEETREILETLTGQRLLRREVREKKIWYELIHERLVPIVKEWLDLDRQFFEFRQARAFVHNNSESDLWRKNPIALLNAGLLTELIPLYQERFRFDAREHELLLRSAIHHRAPSLGFWAEKLGRENAVALIEAATASTRPEERLAAAEASSQVTDVDGRLAAACLSLALKDGEKDIRRAAGLSLAKIATLLELRSLEQLRGLRTERQKRRRAREAFIQMRIGGHPLENLSWLQRRLTGDEAEKQEVRDSRLKIRQRRRIGTLNGMLAGVPWSLTVGLALAAIVAAFPVFEITSYSQWIQKTAMVAAGELFLALLLGAFFGWLTAVETAKDAAAHGEGRWFAALLRSFKFFFIAITTGLILPTITIIQASSRLDSGALFGIGSFLFLPLLLFLFIAFFVQLGRSCLGPTPSARETWFWSLAMGAGPALFGCLVPIGLLIRLAPKVADLLLELTGILFPSVQTSYIIWGVAALVSLATSSSLVAVAISSAKFSFPARARTMDADVRRFRIGAAVVTLLTPLCFGLYSFDSVPLFAPERKITHERELSYIVSEVHYFKLVNSSHLTKFFRVASANGIGHLGNSNAPKPGEILVMPPGSHLSSFDLSSFGRNESIAPGKIALSELNLPELRSGDHLDITEYQNVGILTLLPVDRERWEGKIMVTASGNNLRLVLFSDWKLFNQEYLLRKAVQINGQSDKEPERSRFAPRDPREIEHDREEIFNNLVTYTYRILGRRPRVTALLRDLRKEMLVNSAPQQTELRQDDGRLQDRFSTYLSASYPRTSLRSLAANFRNGVVLPLTPEDEKSLRASWTIKLEARNISGRPQKGEASLKPLRVLFWFQQL